jgi:hypothetical protein
MNSDSVIPVRLKAGQAGLGEPTQAALEVRAAELARSDGRSAVTEADLRNAAAELSAANPPPGPPEIGDSVVGEITAWDDPLDQSGHRVSPLRQEDEAPVAERLILDGLEEADHDTRLASAEEGNI